MLNKIFDNREVNSLKNLAKLLDKKDLNVIVFLVVITFLAGLAEIFGIAGIYFYISLLTNAPILDKIQSYTQQSFSTVIICSAGLLLLFFIVKNFFVYFVNYSLCKFALKKKEAISGRLFSTYLNYPYNVFVQKTISILLRNVNEETRIVFDQVVLPFIKVFADIMGVTCIVVFLIIVQPLITICVASFLFITLLSFYVSLRKKNLELGAKRQKFSKNMIESVNQGLFGFKDTKILGKEQFFIDKFIKNQIETNKIRLFSLSIEQAPRLLTETLIVLTIVLIIIIVQIIEGNVTDVVPLISLFAVAGLRIMMFTNRIINQAQVIQFSSISVQTVVNEIEAAKSFIKDVQVNSPERGSQDFSFQDGLEVKNLQFKYLEDSQLILDNLSFKIEKNSSVAFVGESGVGKSTLIDILATLLEPTAGQILIDGQNIQDVTPQWKSILGYIPQNVYLMNGSLASNIAFGEDNEHINEEHLWECLELAQLSDYARGLPSGIHSNIGDQGVRLSGGQRQRIGIARALYNKPEILILDEATAALDNKTEKEFTKALDKLAGQKTFIYIAHRLTTIKNCDQIHFMKKGKIVSSGKYEDLLKQSKDFATMVNL